MHFSLLLCLISLSTLSKGQHVVDHNCPSRPVLTNFDLKEYLGRWYEISRYEQFFEVGCDCGFADYTLNEDGTVKVRNCCKRLPNTTLSCSIGKAAVSYPDEKPLPAKLSVAFRGKEPTESNYWILDTDYENFSIVYFCKPLPENPEKSAEAFWLLSKSKVLDEETRQKADTYIEKYFDKNAIRVAKQSRDQCGGDNQD
ncbi:apolipoprotein D-like [Culicoides brevitarsis]|uniref:apolipoprotein D-like n=1 Tax=Culicoides brevitarsis TaxID=469753 RepID=UPI00307B631F